MSGGTESLLRPGTVVLGHGYRKLTELQYIARLKVSVLHHRAPNIKIIARPCGADIFDRIFGGIPTFAGTDGRSDPGAQVRYDP